ncbi:dephospho-CoA kinase [Bacillus solimangrovi]|uniref:Dephospho-CoA kinase n=1 Tax=Bacillus solimangrovi TaxID=1305675 RepID=A0A1E5LCQ5_9BACI|nr:dephospho-CoA kinase [Bacillus solimangrovi]OEH91868.1 dephospho-CoA kinase [Bacillus solimangrovi]
MTVIIGLTGGIASGKSTVSNMFRQLNIPVIDADVAARKVVEVGQSAYTQIVKTFGEEVLQEDRTINREKLGSIIFHNQGAREQLNQIVHPAVRSLMNDQKDTYIKAGEKVVVMDIPLLFESKLTYLVDKTIVVYVSTEVQLERLMKRNQLSREEAQARINSQLSLEEKKIMADKFLDNNGTSLETNEQLLQILKQWGICKNS